ncbi:MAG: phosphodiesterase [Candidatus Omnitrophica bacterium]|nr:phosphodiesterase [Candidatus Omnitrophota bacterium]
MAALVISDTHGSVGGWEKVKKYLSGDIDCLFHAGDVYYFGPRNSIPEGHSPGLLSSALNSLNIPLICSKGNCDSDVDQLVSMFPLCSPFAFAFIYGKTILVTHGHHYTQEQLLNLATQWKADIVVTGHTHIARLEKIGNVVFLNPGSCALPKNFPGIGVVDDSSVELLDLRDGSRVERLALSR